ncbi:MAG TPA: hypothetical protein VD813_05665 [Pseudonocardia sp.]|nr:hypothetical protein [Pseudonocardia sp.]
MRISRVVWAALALATVLLTGCGAEVDGVADPTVDPTTMAPPSTGAPSTTPAVPGGLPEGSSADEAAVGGVFQAYYQALLERDFAAACELTAPETTTRLVEELAAQGVPVGSCEEALTLIYQQPEAARVADEVASSAEIQDISVDGERATITWSATTQGQTPSVTNDLRLIDGQWRLLGVNNPS